MPEFTLGMALFGSWPRIGGALALGLLLASRSAQGVCPVVTTTADALVAPPASLRQCIEQANSSAGHDRVTFAGSAFQPGGVIVLVGQLPSLADPAGMTIDGEGAGRVTIRGPAATAAAFELRSGNNVLRDLTVRGMVGTGLGQGAAVVIRTGSSSNSLLGNTITQNGGEGIFFEGSSSGNLIDGNTLTSNGFISINLRNSTGTCATPNVITRNIINDNFEGIYVVASDCVRIDGNELRGNRLHAIRLATTSQTVVSNNQISGFGAIGIFNGSTRNRITLNTITTAVEYAIAVGDTGTNTNLIDRNVIAGVFRNDGGSALVAGAYVYSGTDNSILQNTIDLVEGMGVYVAGAPTNFRVQNNFVSRTRTPCVVADSDPTAIISHNGCWDTDGGTCGGGCTAGPGTILANPQFMNPAGLDYRLSECGSPGINAGVDLLAAQPDMTPSGPGNWIGPGPDLGALESTCLGTDAGGGDGGTPDGGADSGVPDGGRPDGGPPDGGQPDGATSDSGVDSGSPDGSVPDSGPGDGGPPDGGAGDGGVAADGGAGGDDQVPRVLSLGCECDAGAPGPLLLLALIAWRLHTGRLRRRTRG